MKAVILDRMNRLDTMLRSSFKKGAGGDDDAAAKADGEKLQDDIEAADERRAAGFSNNDKKQKPGDATILPADPDEFKPDLEGRGHVGGGVYDRGGYIHVVGAMTPKKAQIVAALAQEKGWTKLAVYNHDHATMNKNAASMLMQCGIACVGDPKALPKMHVFVEAAKQIMEHQQMQAHMYRKEAEAQTQRPQPAPGPAGP